MVGRDNTLVCTKFIITTTSKSVCEVQSTERISLLHLIAAVKVLEPAPIFFARFEQN
jgi:hypothetical protein